MVKGDDNLKLRPYQQECVELVNSKDEGRYVISLATGLGKTVIFANFKRKGRTLILSHREELVRQPEKYFDCSYGVERANEHSNGEEVISASIQTISKDNRLSKFKPDDFHTIIIDECHHAIAPSYIKVLDYFTGAKLRIGVTATPKRGDNVRLTDVFDEIIFERDLRWGIKNKYLCPVRCERVTAQFSLKNVHKQMGDFNQKELEKQMISQSVITTATKTYIEECHNKGRHTLIYCVTRQVCEFLKSTIDKLLPTKERNKVMVLTGKTPEEERTDIIERFKQGDCLCIINCMVLKEGTDMPICDTIINLRPTSSTSLYQQMVGRATRLSEGKEYCLIIDLPKQNCKMLSS